ncbi:MAG: hypothetical protein JWP81_4647 [Ferruginibacter sp.]|nr:hypothetical protein [Ferruginibacter sp.]
MSGKSAVLMKIEPFYLCRKAFKKLRTPGSKRVTFSDCLKNYLKHQFIEAKLKNF